MSQRDTDKVIVGRVRRPQGTKGYVLIDVLSDHPNRFAPGHKVFIGGVVYVIQDVRMREGGALVKFEGIDSPEVAKKLRNSDVTVDASQLSPLPKGVYYHYHLIGMQVRTVDGRSLGAISAVLKTGSNDVYVVNDGQRELLVPAISEVVREVDTARGEMVVDLPEGLEPGLVSP